MAENYLILSNDPDTHIVVLRVQDGDWTTGANFRDAIYDLSLVVPGSAQTFALMQLPFDFGAALNYLTRQIQYQIDSGTLTITPPMWKAENGRFAGTCELTPEAFIPEVDTPSAS